MPIGINEVARISTRLNFSGIADIVNVFWAQNQTLGIVTDAEAEADAGALAEILFTTIQAQMSNLVTYEDISVTNINTGIPVGTSPWPTLTVGLSAADAASTPVAALVLARTDLARVQARKYLGLFTETAKVGSAWSAGMLTALGNFAIQWDLPQTVNGRNWEFGVWAGPVKAYRTFRNTAVMADSRTQRRRTPGRGS